MKRNTFGKILSILLAVVMLASMLPATLLTASAEDVAAEPEAFYSFGNAEGTFSSNAAVKGYTDNHTNWRVFGYGSTGEGGDRIGMVTGTAPDKIARFRSKVNGKVWVAFEIDPTDDNLTAGAYEFWLNTKELSGELGGSSTSGRGDIWVAKYDPEKTTGEEYMTDKNLVASNVALKASEKKVMGSCVISDPTSKYIVIIQTTLCEALFRGFGVTRTGDIQWTEEFAFTGSGTKYFVNTGAAGDYDDYGTNNPNWKYIGRDANWVDGRMYINSNLLFLRVEATPGKSWFALQTKFLNEELTAGTYEVIVSAKEIWTWPSGASRSLTGYVAKVKDGKAPEDYLDPLNATGTATTFTGGGSTPNPISLGTCVIDDVDAEYVLILENAGFDFQIKNVTFKRVGDVPPAEEEVETEVYSLKDGPGGAVFNNATKYGVKNVNWKYFDRSDEFKAATTAGWQTSSYAGTISSGSQMRFQDHRDNLVADAWTAFKFRVTEPMKAGEYDLKINLLNVYPNEKGSGSGKKLAAWVAPYEEGKDSGAYYKIQKNQVRGLNTVAAPGVLDLGSFMIEDTSDEYILILEVDGAEFYISDFSVSYKGPVREIEKFSFVGVNSSLHTGTAYENYGTANPNWRAYDLSDDYVTANQKAWAGSNLTDAFRFSDLSSVKDAWTAFKIKITDEDLTPGEYKLNYRLHNYYPANDNSGSSQYLGIYLAPTMDGKDAVDYRADYNAIKQLNRVNYKTADALISTDSFYITDTSKEFVLILELEGCEIWSKGFELERVGDLPADAEFELDYSRFSLEPGQTAAPRVRYKNDSKKLIAAVAPFESSNEDIITVTKTGVVKGVNPGRANVSTTVDGKKLTSPNFVVLAGTRVSGNVSVFAYSTVDGVAGTDGITSAQLTAGTVASVPVETTVKVTAEKEVNGAKFSHWTTSGGTFLSDDPEYSFKANTNAAVIAVYESEELTEGEVTVSFYTDFGSLLDAVKADVNSPFSAFRDAITNGTYRGYTITGWKGVNGDFTGSEEITKDTTAVATYDAYTQYTVTVDGDAKSYDYNAPVQAKSDADNFSYWTRDGKIVSYNAEYNFYAWGNTTIASVKTGATTPKVAVVLANDGDDYMVEYDLPTGYTFVEAGIVGYSQGTPTVASFGSKASSKKDLGSHGQFTAKCDEDVVRGYVMFKDTNGYILVSYAD